MRWEYTAPDKKTFVSDGHTSYSYIPADKQVIRGQIRADNEATTAVCSSRARGNLTRDFTVSYVDSGESPAPGPASSARPR